MKKVGQFSIEIPRSSSLDKDIWGDIFKGDDDSDVALWGIVKWNVPQRQELLAPAVERFRENFREETGYRIKTSTKSNPYSGDYVQMYICRPVEKMDEVLKAMAEYKPKEGIALDIEEDGFGRVKRAEIAKAI